MLEILLAQFRFHVLAGACIIRPFVYLFLCYFILGFRSILVPPRCFRHRYRYGGHLCFILYKLAKPLVVFPILYFVFKKETKRWGCQWWIRNLYTAIAIDSTCTCTKKLLTALWQSLEQYDTSLHLEEHFMIPPLLPCNAPHVTHENLVSSPPFSSTDVPPIPWIIWCRSLWKLTASGCCWKFRCNMSRTGGNSSLVRFP